MVGTSNKSDPGIAIDQPFQGYHPGKLSPLFVAMNDWDNQQIFGIQPQAFRSEITGTNAGTASTTSSSGSTDGSTESTSSTEGEDWDGS